MTSRSDEWRRCTSEWGLLEMTNHEFLDKERRKERTTFADGTTVTVDRDANSVEIRPEVEIAR
jgi:hypothetical protein